MTIEELRQKLFFATKTFDEFYALYAKFCEEISSINKRQSCGRLLGCMNRIHEDYAELKLLFDNEFLDGVLADDVPEEQMLRCAACGKPLHEIEINVDDFQGGDYMAREPLWPQSGAKEKGYVYIDTARAWTGDEDLSDEERRERICCPHCGEYPFKNDHIAMEKLLEITFYFMPEDDGGDGDDSDV